MNNAPCNNKECPVITLGMNYCVGGSEIDPPCEAMDIGQLQELRDEIDENNHDKGE